VTIEAGYDDRSSYPAPFCLGRFSGARVGTVRTCDLCGKQSPEAETLTWTTAVENGRRRIFCDTCSREHLRAMESKLDSEWW